jgi:ketosteroid isomerase-like protein
VVFEIRVFNRYRGGGSSLEGSMTERDEFLGWIGTVLKDAEVAIHNGDAAPRAAIWSSREPVTVLGAWISGSGQQEVKEIFHQLEASFSDCTAYSHEVIAADTIGEMAYTVGYEHTQASINGEPREYTLRVTQIYRRENGDWKVVHRHADTLTQPE